MARTRDRQGKKASRAKLVILAGLVVVLALTSAHAGYEISEAGKLARLERAARGISWRSVDWNIRTDSEQHAAALRHLEYVARELFGYDLQYVKDFSKETGDYGQTISGKDFLGEAHREILIDEDLKTESRIVVLAHELAHVLQPPMISREGGEVFAGSVEFLVAERNGIDVFNKSANYLSNFKGSLGVMRDYRSDLYWAAGVLSGDY